MSSSCEITILALLPFSFFLLQPSFFLACFFFSFFSSLLRTICFFFFNYMSLSWWTTGRSKKLEWEARASFLTSCCIETSWCPIESPYSSSKTSSLKYWTQYMMWAYTRTFYKILPYSINYSGKKKKNKLLS